MAWTDTIVLEKSYTVAASFRYSYYVYVPCDGDSIWWTRYLLTNRRNPSAKGAPHLVEAVFCKLCAAAQYSLVFNAPARSAGWITVTPSTITDITGVFCVGTSGENVTYTAVVPTGGQIVWEYARTTVSGTANIVIRDSGGAEIAAGYYAIPTDGVNRYVSGYDTSLYNEISRTYLTNALPADTYTVRVTAAGTTGHARIYDRCVYAIDNSTLGSPYVMAHPFMPQSSPAAVIGVSGDCEYAVRFKPAGNPMADLEYASGTHGYETDATSFYLETTGFNGAVTDITATFIAAGTYQGTRWVSRYVACTFQTICYTRVGTVNTIQLNWQLRWREHQYIAQVVQTLLANADFSEIFIGMLMDWNLPNGGAPILQCSGQTYAIGYATPVAVESYSPPVGNCCSMIAGTDWASDVQLLYPKVCEGFISSPNQEAVLALVTSRNDGMIKDYRYLVKAQGGTIVNLPVGTVIPYCASWRVRRGVS